MSVIFAAGLDGMVVIGADSRSHNQVTGERSADTIKVRPINSKVYAAKAGYGPDAENVWTELNDTLGIESKSPREVAKLLRVIGSITYKRCKNRASSMGQIDPGLFMIVAGLTADGDSEVHYLNFQLDEFLELECTAFGPDHAHHAAVKLFAECDDASVDINGWARKLVDRCVEKAPHAIGYPVHLHLIRPEGVEHRILEGENPALES